MSETAVKKAEGGPASKPVDSAIASIQNQNRANGEDLVTQPAWTVTGVRFTNLVCNREIP